MNWFELMKYTPEERAHLDWLYGIYDRETSAGHFKETICQLASKLMDALHTKVETRCREVDPISWATWDREVEANHREHEAENEAQR